MDMENEIETPPANIEALLQIESELNAEDPMDRFSTPNLVRAFQILEVALDIESGYATNNINLWSTMDDVFYCLGTAIAFDTELNYDLF